MESEPGRRLERLDHREEAARRLPRLRLPASTHAHRRRESAFESGRARRARCPQQRRGGNVGSSNRSWGTSSKPSSGSHPPGACRSAGIARSPRMDSVAVRTNDRASESRELDQAFGEAALQPLRSRRWAGRIRRADDEVDLRTRRHLRPGGRVLVGHDPAVVVRVVGRVGHTAASKACSICWRAVAPEAIELDAAAEALRAAKQPLIVAGGGVLYSDGGCDALRRFVETHRVPVAETQAGKSALPWDTRCRRARSA